MAFKRTAYRFRKDLTANELRERLDYDPETGEFWTKPRKIGTIQTFGKTRVPAVTISLQSKDGRWRHYYAHRLAYLWMTGEWPVAEVDHINNVSTDNRWENLRAATHTENNRNKEYSGFGTSGYLGASLHKASGLWRATFRRKTLGYFKTPEEAHEAYKKAAIEVYGEFAHVSLRKNSSSQDQ